MIEEVFRDLPKIQVSEEFLPRVMSTVYGHHVRTQIRFRQVFLLCLALVGLSFSLFLWDVWNFQRHQGLNQFSQAFDQKLDLLIHHMGVSFSDWTGILAASWQWITGAESLIFSRSHSIILGLMIVAVALIGFAIKKYLESLHHTSR